MNRKKNDVQLLNVLPVLFLHMNKPILQVYVHIGNEPQTRCVMKHKYPHTRQIPEMSIIVKSIGQGQDVKI
jgi:hypothetical protein